MEAKIIGVRVARNHNGNKQVIEELFMGTVNRIGLEYLADLTNESTDTEILVSYFEWRLQEPKIVTLSTEETKQRFEEEYEFLVDKYEEFVSEKDNSATKEKLEEWEKYGLVEFRLTEYGVGYTAGIDNAALGNQLAWGEDSWEDIIENGDLDEFVRLLDDATL